MTPKLLLASLMIGMGSCADQSIVQRQPAFSRGTCEDLIAPFFSANYRYVKSFRDFYQHTSLHRKRLVIMGEYLIDNFREHFPNVEKRKLIDFLNLHDEAKLNLEYARYKDKPLLEALYQYYGRGTHTLSEEDQIEMRQIIEYLNQKDYDVALKFFKKHRMLNKYGNPNSMALEYLKLEKIVDAVDRGMNQVSPEEFSRQMKAASEFLSDQSDVELATELESIYHQLLKGILRPTRENSSLVNDMNL